MGSREPADGTACRALRAAEIAALVACAVLSGVALLLAGHAQPFADDFARAHLLLREIPGYVAATYVAWSGRWAATALDALLLSGLDPTRHYWVMLLVVNAVLLAGTYAFLRAACGAELPRRTALLVSWVGGVLALAAGPSPGWTVFWVTGGVENRLVIGLALLLGAVLVRPLPGPRGLGLGGTALLAFAVAGMHELYGALLLVVLATGAAAALRARHPARHRWLLALAGSAAGFAIVVAAPGNAVRGALYPLAGDPTRTLGVAGWQAREHLVTWALDARLLAASLFVAVHPRLGALRPPWIGLPGIPAKALVPGAWLACLALGFLAPSWALGGPMPWRTLDGLHLVFLIGWFATLLTWARGPRTAEPQVPRFLATTASLVFALGVLTDDVTRDGVWDLQDRLFPWHAAIDRRHEAARALFADGLERRGLGHRAHDPRFRFMRFGRLVVPPAPRKPRVFARFELAERPDCPANVQFAQYFRLRSVRVDEEAEVD